MSIVSNKVEYSRIILFESMLQSTSAIDEKNDKGSLLCVDNKYLNVSILNKDLKQIPAKYRFALDEFPSVSETLLLQAYTTTYGVPVARGRSSMRTFLPVLCRDGTVFAAISLIDAILYPLIPSNLHLRTISV